MFLDFLVVPKRNLTLFPSSSVREAFFTRTFAFFTVVLVIGIDEVKKWDKKRKKEPSVEGRSQRKKETSRKEKYERGGEKEGHGSKKQHVGCSPSIDQETLGPADSERLFSTPMM